MTPAGSRGNGRPSTPDFVGHSATAEWLLAAAVSLGVSLLIVAPFFWLGSASGHDFEFHITSWLDVAGQWKEGILLPRWAEWANHGFGEPRFLFYPPLSWLLAPALSFFVPWNYLPVAFIVLVQTAAGIFAFAFARRMLPRRESLFAAVLYAASPYALLIVYIRSDFAELLALSFFPLLFLAALRIGNILENGKRLTAIAWFAVFFAAVWLSDAPVGVIVTYSSVLLFAWSGLAAKSWKPLARGAAGMALGFGIAGFYLVPAAYEQRWVNIAQVLASGLLPSQNFLYTEINDPEHTLFNWIASTTAIVIIVIAGIAAIAVHRGNERPNDGTTHDAGITSQEEKLWRALLLLSAAATLMMLRLTFFLWQILPKLRFVQFPWRWMSIVALSFAYFAAGASAKPRLRWLWVTALIAVLVVAATFFVRNTWWDADDIATLQDGVEQGQGYDGVDEYDPLGDDHYNLPAKAPQASILPADETAQVPAGAKIHLDLWTAEKREVQVESAEPIRLGLRLLNYPAWRVEVNGVPVTPETAADSGQVVLPLPGGKSLVRASFTRTWDRTVGGIVSLAGLLIAVVLLFKR
jgi:6-pyruvoyl-tetrahydropterin synthase related domain